MCIGGRGRGELRRSAKTEQRNDNEFPSVYVLVEGAKMNSDGVRRQSSVVIMKFHMYVLCLTV